MDSNKEFQFMLQFAKERSNEASEPWDKIEREQLRALWTAYCIHENLDRDTRGYDEALTELWQSVVEDSVICDTDEFHDLPHFGLYMGAMLS